VSPSRGDSSFGGRSLESEAGGLASGSGLKMFNILNLEN
jgi:hypothetical protein